MKDVYVLRDTAGRIYCIADDFDRASMEMHRFSPEAQRSMTVENHDLLEEGD